MKNKKTAPRRLRRSPYTRAILMLSSVPLSALAQYQGEGGGDADDKQTPAAQTAAPSAAPPTPPATPVHQLSEVHVTGKAIDDGYERDVSTVGAKMPAAIRDIPQPVTVIARAVIDAQGAASLQDAVRYVPDITFAAAEGGTIGNNITLRGFSARTDIYIDGFRDRGQYYRDTFFLDSLEVLEGPSSMLFGRGSTGGVINQVSKLPTARAHDEFSATLGTSDYYRTTADLNHPLSDDAAFRIEGMAQSVHSTRDVMQNEDYGAAPSLRLKISPKTEVIVSGLLEHNHDMPDYGLPPLNGQPASVSRNNFYGLTDDATQQNVAVISGRIKYEALPGLTLRNQSQYSRYIVDARETAAAKVGIYTNGVFTQLKTFANGNTTSLPQDQLYVQLGSHDRNIRDSSFDNQTDLIANFDTGPIRHTLLIGGEIGRDTYDNQGFTRNNLPVFQLDSPVYESTPANVTTTSGNLAQSSADSDALYFNDTVTISEHWKAVGGLRWDRFAAQLTTSPPAGGALSATTVGSAKQDVYYDSVRTGVLYQPTIAQTYYISYGTSFDPSLEYLTVTAGQQALPPEKNHSYEVGAKWDLLNKSLSVTSALFQIKQENARSQVETGVYELVGTERVNGAEVTAVGHLTKKWQVFGGYTYLDPKIINASTLDGTNGKTLSNTPRNDATLWTAYSITPSWETGTGLVYLSSRYVTNTDTVRVNSYVRWDAMVAFHQPKYDVRLNLLNLSNTHYYDSLIQSDSGRSVPGASATALLSFDYKI